MDNGRETHVTPFDIRDSVSGDAAAIDRLYPDAFPGEELRPLVKALLEDTAEVVSRVAVAETTLIGHIVLTPCTVTGGDAAVALLGPLAVATTWQRSGIGSALVQSGLDRLRFADIHHVLVLGDPAYYGRFGFEPERSIAPPFPLVEDWREAWQSIPLQGARLSPRGTLTVPRAWNAPALWAP